MVLASSVGLLYGMVFEGNISQDDSSKLYTNLDDSDIYI